MQLYGFIINDEDSND